nr:sister chromatid cohesion subunit [Farysia itapuensis]
MARSITRQRKAPKSAKTKSANGKKVAAVAPVESDDSLTDLESEREASDEEILSSDGEVLDDDENDADFGSSRKTKTARRTSAGAKPRKSNGTPRSNKTFKAATTSRPNTKASGPSKPRAGTAKSRAAVNRDELPVNDDNEIYNAVKDPNSALQSTAEDWVVSFQQDQGQALATLVNFVIRTCGCNGSIDENQVVDIDNVVDNLEDLQEVFKKQPIPSYPIVSKSKTFKSFRKSLSEFLHRLVMSAYEAEVLAVDGFMDPYLAWVSAMSSSSLRSFRHTATVIALWTISAINEVSGQAIKDLTAATKQRDAEKKRARADKSRLKELEAKVTSTRKFKTKLSGYVDEFINSVFVLRFRDSDAGIRSECVESLGSWMKKHPAQYVQTTYLRYVGWVLSDIDSTVRMAAVQAMSGLYTKDNFGSSIRQFTDMFKTRLVQMATGDVELGVRIATIQVLVMIDKHDLLESEQRDILATHIFDVEPRIRTAVASFVANILEEKVSESAGDLGAVSAASKKKGAQAEEQRTEEAKLGYKCLAELLVKYGKLLGKSETADAGEEDLTLVVEGAKEGRVGMAVEALWDAVPSLQQWKALIELLLLDHSGKTTTSKKGAKTATNGSSDSAAPDAYRLESEEEAILVETLVAAVRKVYKRAEATDDVEDSSKEDVTRAMIAALPKLLAKYRTDAPRIGDLLLLPQAMDLEMYTEMQESTAYETLWDDVSAQIHRHVEPLLLTHAAQTVRKLMSTSSQATVNTTKLSTLEEGLVSSLRDTVSNRDVETAGFSEDEVHSLAANLLRLHLVGQVCNTSDSLSDDEGGQATSGWDIVLGLASRGKLAYLEEEELVQNAISILSLYIMWETRRAVMPDAASQPSALESLLIKRTSVLSLLNDFVSSTQSQACVGVRRVAFENLLTIHMLYGALPPADVAGAGDSSVPTMDSSATKLGPKVPSILQLQCEADVQSQCAHFIETEIARYLETSGIADKDAQSAAGESDDDEAKTPSKNKRQAATSETKAPARPAHTELQAEHIFCTTVSTFVSSIRIGVVDAKYSTAVLVHFGRLGAIYDSCCKVLIDVLKEEAIFGGYNRAVIIESCIWDSLREAFELYIDLNDSAAESRFVSLSRQLANALVVRGAGFTALRTIDAKCLISLHSRASEHIAQKVAAADRNGDKRSRQKMPSMYKGMANLLLSATPTDAVKIKSAMDRAFRAINLQIPPSSKAWDAQRSYEKRLLRIAAKSALFTAGDTSGNARKASMALPSGGIDSGSELSDVEDDEEGSLLSGNRMLPTPVRGGRKRSTTTRDEGVQGNTAEQEEGDEEMPAFLASSPIALDTRKRRKT